MDPIKCANKGDVEFFKAAELDLIQKSRDDGGSSVLALAAWMGHLNCCRVIYQRCPQLLYEVNRYGDSPLHEAAKAGKPEIIRCLLYARALLEALEAGAEDLIKMGKRNLSADSKLLMMQGWMQYTALHYATIRGCRESVQWLVNADPSRKLLMVVDANKRTALHAAAKRGHSDIVKGLIFPKILMTLSISEWSAARLMHKWEKHNKSTSNPSDVSMAFELYEEIYNSVAVESEHLKESSRSAQDEYKKFVKDMLLMVDSKACTALHHAVENGFFDIAEHLVENGFDDNVGHLLLTVQNHKGKTFIQIAMEKNHLSFMACLLRNERILTINQALLPDRISVAIRKLLIEKQPEGCKLRIGERGWTLLHHVTSNGDVTTIEDILEFSPECAKLVDSEGQNFVHLAAKLEDAKVIRHIMASPKVDDNVLNLQDINGNTPFHIATSNENASVGLAMVYNPRINKFALNKHGKTALAAINFEYDKRRAGVYGYIDIDRLDEKDLKDRSDFDLLVGALISTVSFTVGITVPGGYFSDGPNQGTAVLYQKASFEVFVVSNTIALALSLYAVFSHFCTKHLTDTKDIIYQLQVATFCSLGSIFAMMVAFITGSYAVLAVSARLAITVCVICCFFFGFAIRSMCKMIQQKKKKACTSFVDWCGIRI